MRVRRIALMMVAKLAVALVLRFLPGVDQPGSRTVQLRPFGPQGAIALEMVPESRGKTGSFLRGGPLDVRLEEEEPPELSRMPRFIPYVVPAPRTAPNRSA